MNPVIKGILDDLMSGKIRESDAASHIDQPGLPQEKMDRDIKKYFAIPKPAKPAPEDGG